MFDNCRSANTVRLTLILLYGFSALVSAQGHMQTLQKVEEEVSKVRTKNVQTQGSSCGSDTWGHRLLASCIFARKKEPVAIPHFECEGRCLKLRCWNKNDMRMPPAPRSGKLHPKWNLGPSRGEGAPEANRWDIGTSNHHATWRFRHFPTELKPESPDSKVRNNRYRVAGRIWSQLSSRYCCSLTDFSCAHFWAFFLED